MGETIDRFVYNFSRIAILIPILFVVIGISMKVMGYNFSTPSSTITQLPVTPSITAQSNPFARIVKDSSAQELKLDLKGPLSCQGSFDTFSAQVKIKDFNIRGTFKQKEREEQILVKGDCLYRWIDKDKTGKRLCGISQYIPILNALSQFDMLNFNTILSIIPNTKNPTNLTNADVQELTKTCKKEEIDTAVFTIPSTITFTDSSLTPAPVK